MKKLLLISALLISSNCFSQAVKTQNYDKVITRGDTTFCYKKGVLMASVIMRGNKISTTKKKKQ